MNKLITKITAPNGGVFTGQGTNTYLIGQEDITLVDPGPNIKEHIQAILKRGAGKIKRILVTHTHTDHSPAALPISKKYKLIFGFGFCGSLTTFSGWSFQLFKLINKGFYKLFFLNSILIATLGVFAIGLGHLVAKKITN